MCAVRLWRPIISKCAILETSEDPVFTVRICMSVMDICLLGEALAFVKYMCTVRKKILIYKFYKTFKLVKEYII